MKVLICAAIAALSVAPALAQEPALILPPGFKATVVADGIKGVRHLAFGANGALYVSTRGQGATGLVALHLDDQHKADKIETFGTVTGGTGLRTYKGSLYAASPTTIYRYALTKDLVPVGDPVVVIDGMPGTGGSGSHSLAFDGKGNLFVSLDGSGNTCVDPKAPTVGLNPCPIVNGRASVWRFADNKTGQKFPADGELFATGVRSMIGMEWSPQARALYGVTHGRDQTQQQFPTLLSAADGDAVADEMHRIEKGADLGWPYTYWDAVRKVRLTAPEYDGDNKTPADAKYATPIAAFAKQVAPEEVVFYNARQFPAKYRGGAFIPTHGANGPKIPGGHGGYNVIFVPIDRNGRAGTPEVFADGFAGPTADDKYSGHAVYRPVGAAVGPDGALYVGESNKGRIWRISYGE